MEGLLANWGFCTESAALTEGGIYYEDPLITPLVQLDPISART